VDPVSNFMVRPLPLLLYWSGVLHNAVMLPSYAGSAVADMNAAAPDCSSARGQKLRCVHEQLVCRTTRWISAGPASARDRSRGCGRYTTATAPAAPDVSLLLQQSHTAACVSVYVWHWGGVDVSPGTAAAVDATHPFSGLGCKSEVLLMVHVDAENPVLQLSRASIEPPVTLQTGARATTTASAARPATLQQEVCSIGRLLTGCSLEVLEFNVSAMNLTAPPVLPGRPNCRTASSLHLFGHGHAYCW
jgi:hypothetical protein